MWYLSAVLTPPVLGAFIPPERTDEMKRLTLLVLGISLAAARSRAEDVVLTITPEFGFSSDHVTLCRVTARNRSGHAVDVRGIAFEARAWEDGVPVMTEQGRFGGRIGPGETVESRIGFNGVFRQFTVEPAAGKRPRGGSGRSRQGTSKAPKKSSAKSSSKAKKKRA
jgi:hypothetical protein